MYIEVSGVLAAAVAANGTVSVSLPSPYDAGRVAAGLDHRLVMNQGLLVAPQDFTVTLAGSSVTITNKTVGSWQAGYAFILQLNQPGDAAKTVSPAAMTDKFVGAALTKLVNLGSPVAASATAVMAATAVAAGAVNVLPATVIVPGGCAGRALVVVSSNSGDTTQTVTVTGKDIYGVTMTQTFTLNGTTAVNGTKAFYQVTSVVASAALTGNLSVGTLSVFGLPVPLAASGFVIKDMTDGATSGTAGTFVVADVTSDGATSTTGDVRGTYAPNSAPNGTHYYHVLLVSPDAGYAGEPQA